MQHPLQATMRSVSQRLRSALDTTAAYGHNLTAGQARESTVADALRPFIPDRFGVLDGIATNLKGKKSAQQDILVFDRIAGAPFVHHRDTGVLPVELVSASIQVKTSVSASDMQGVVDNLASLKRLIPNVPRPLLTITPDGVQPVETIAKPMCIGLAYTSRTDGGQLMYAFAEANRELAPHDRADGLVVVDQGLVLWASGDEDGGTAGADPQAGAIGVRPEDASRMAWSTTGKDSLLLFYLLLTHHLSTYVQPAYSPGAYISASGVLNHQGHWSGALADIGYDMG